MSRAHWSHGHGSDMPVTQGQVPVPASRCRRWCLHRSCPLRGLSVLVKISGAHSAVSLKIIQRAGGRHNGGRRWGQASCRGVRGLGSLREPGVLVLVMFWVPTAQGGLGVLGARRAGGIAVLHSGAGVFWLPGARVWSITALYLLGFLRGLQVLEAVLISLLLPEEAKPPSFPASLHASRCPQTELPGGAWGPGEGLCWGDATREPLAGACGAVAVPSPAPGGMGPPRPPSLDGCRSQECTGHGAQGVQGALLSRSGSKRAGSAQAQTKAFCASSLCASLFPSPPGFCLVSPSFITPPATAALPLGGGDVV